MTCPDKFKEPYFYTVYEYDDCKTPHKTDKVFTLDFAKVIATWGNIRSESITLSFFTSMFETINLLSGYYASHDPDLNEIIIHWRAPTWKLVRIK